MSEARVLFSHSISRVRLAQMQQNLWNFITEFEELYDAANNPQACVAMIHLVVHVHQSVVDCGPAFVFWQFPTERLLGLLQPYAQSTKNPTSNLIKNTLWIQYFMLLKQITSHFRTHDLAAPSFTVGGFEGLHPVSAHAFTQAELNQLRLLQPM